MKKVLLCSFFLYFAYLCNAQDSKYMHLEYENVSVLQDKQWINPQLNLYGSSSKDENRWGTYYFALLNPFWGQIYGGLTYKLTSWLTVNAGLGLETNEKPVRYNLGAFAGGEKWSLLQIYEYGGSGFWYYVVYNYQLFPNFKAGILAKRYVGWGPNFEYNFGESSWTLQLAPVYDPEVKQMKLLTLIRYQL